MLRDLKKYIKKIKGKETKKKLVSEMKIK